MGVVKLDRQKITSRLLRWYHKNGRDLPWRRTSDPYAVWGSEVMLQQTQVTTVIPYYEKFMAAFPTVTSLAHASLDAVLKIWEGLGYYARARNLHRTARILLEQYKGEIPDDIRSLIALPGIGRSTAGAIISIAYGKRAPILDGNIRRVLCRLFAIQEDPAHTQVRKGLWDLSERLVPDKDPRSFNQALMDLGAMVCTPKDPNCPACCLKSFCRGYQKGIQETLPIKSRRRKIPHHGVSVGIIWKGQKILITRRPTEGFLGGLWEFPGGKIEDGEPPATAVAREIQEELKITISVGDLLTTVRHAYSHFRITLHAFHCNYKKGTLRTPNPYLWISPDELNLYPFPAANRKVIDVLMKVHHTATI